MKGKTWVLGLFFVASLNLYCQKQTETPLRIDTEDAQNLALEEEVLKLVNEIRISKKLNPLQYQKGLSLAARSHAQDMAIDNYMEHSTYDRQNDKLVLVCGTFDRIKKFISFPYLGENISAGKTTAKETVDGWMNSTGHRANILNPNYKYQGVGYYYNLNSIYKHYWVQNFGG